VRCAAHSPGCPCRVPPGPQPPPGADLLTSGWCRQAGGLHRKRQGVIWLLKRNCS
jgi:hypothetical protein